MPFSMKMIIDLPELKTILMQHYLEIMCWIWMLFYL
jgi:hypothetical protein